MKYIKSYYFALLSLVILLWTASSCKTTKQVQLSQLKMAPYTGEANPSDSLYFKALNYKFSNQKHAALAEFQKFVKLNPNEPAPYYHMARIYVEMGNLKEALPLIEQAYYLNTNNPFYRSMYADALAFSGQFEKGANLYNELLSGKSKKLEYLLKQLAYYNEAKRYDKMLDVINTIDQYTDIEDEDIENLRLETYALKGDKRNIEKILLKKVDRYPDSHEPKLKLIQFYELTGNVKKLVALKKQFNFQSNTREDKVAKLALLVRSNDMNSYLRIARNTFTGTKSDTQAIRIFLESYFITIFNKDPIKNSQVVNEFEKLAMSKEALPEAAEFLVGYYSEAQIEKKKVYYSIRALDLKSTDHRLFFHIHEYYKNNNKEDSTLLFAKKYTALYDSFPIGHFFLANNHNKLKQYDLALFHYNTAYDQIKNSSENIFKAVLQGDMAKIYKKQNQLEKSDAAFEIAIKYDSTHYANMNDYAYSLAERKIHLEKALHLSNITIIAEPNNIYYLDTYGYILYLQGDYENAKNHLLRAIEKSNNPTHFLWEHLAEVEYKLGNTDKAIEYLEIAISNGGDKQKLQEKIQSIKPR